MSKTVFSDKREDSADMDFKSEHQILTNRKAKLEERVCFSLKVIETIKGNKQRSE